MLELIIFDLNEVAVVFDVVFSKYRLRPTWFVQNLDKEFKMKYLGNMTLLGTRGICYFSKKNQYHFKHYASKDIYFLEKKHITRAHCVKHRPEMRLSHLGSGLAQSLLPGRTGHCERLSLTTVERLAVHLFWLQHFILDFGTL